MSDIKAFLDGLIDQTAALCDKLEARIQVIETPAAGGSSVPITRQVIAGAGLSGGGALSADVTLALQTPGTLTNTTANTATGSHTHAVTASTDVSAGTAALLKSDASGNLKLHALLVTDTTKVTNLNADMVDGVHGTALVPYTGATGNVDVGLFNATAYELHAGALATNAARDGVTNPKFVITGGSGMAQYNSGGTIIAQIDGLGILTGSSVNVATGSLYLQGAAPRIIADMDGLPESRLNFQTSTVNASTSMASIPNGTNTSAYLIVRNSSTPNAAHQWCGMGITATAALFQSSYRTSGGALPVTFLMLNTEVMRLTSAGALRVGGGAAVGTDAAGNLEVSGTTLHGDDVTMADARNVIVNATTGTKFGTAITQKLAFYGSTPIVQRAAAAQAAAPAGGTGATAGAYDTAAHRDSLISLVNEMRTVLVNLGLMKGAA